MTMSDYRCDTCSYVGPAMAGNCHNTCNSPVFKSENDKFVVLVNNIRGPRVGPRFSSHAAMNGWANWPLEFDPIWMESDCGLHSSLKA